jgi:hypothetical protein
LFLLKKKEMQNKLIYHREKLTSHSITAAATAAAAAKIK